uniref:Uncharacterized protein n=1 Tax=Oryza glumipatula TaxID=40148 RepID=A0A0E0A4R2_9ORYZ
MTGCVLPEATLACRSNASLTKNFNLQRVVSLCTRIGSMCHKSNMRANSGKREEGKDHLAHNRAKLAH